MSKQHKWHKEIKAWADGAEIESRCNDEQYWIRNETPAWNPSFQYRIKPQPKEPQYLYVIRHPQNDSLMLNEYPDNGKFYVGKLELKVNDENN